MENPEPDWAGISTYVWEGIRTSVYEDEQAMADEFSRLVEEQFWASVQQELAEDDDDRYMGSDSDFSDHALGIDY